MSLWSTTFLEQAAGVTAASVKTFIEACDEVLKRVEDRTPVGNPDLWHPPYWPKGYTPGTLKASWTTEQEVLTNGAKVTIQNPQPYAMRIETGAWSTQAPQGMLRVTLKEFPDILAAAAAVNKL